MKKSVLVIGRGDGLGNLIVKKYQDTHKVFSISRSEERDYHTNVTHIKTPVESFFENYKDFKKMSLSLIVFVLSPWGETGLLKTEEYDDFLKAGPYNFLKVFNDLESNGCIRKDATIVSVGSISSEEALQYNLDVKHPFYSIMKLTQKAIANQLSKIHNNYKLSNITLGSIGEDDGLISYNDCVSTIDYIYNLQSGVSFIDVALVSKNDKK